jgi:hypothetical protein
MFVFRIDKAVRGEFDIINAIIMRITATPAAIATYRFFKPGPFGDSCSQ